MTSMTNHHHLLPELRSLHGLRQHEPTAAANSSARVLVRGQFVRKRKLSCVPPTLLATLPTSLLTAALVCAAKG